MFYRAIISYKGDVVEVELGNWATPKEALYRAKAVGEEIFDTGGGTDKPSVNVKPHKIRDYAIESNEKGSKHE